jgi:hypothetical protein
MTHKFLAFLWYFGVILSLALVAGIFAVVGMSPHALHSAELTLNPDRVGLISHVAFVTKDASLFPDGSHWWIIEELAAFFPIVAPLGALAVVLMLVGYWGMRNHRHA